MISPLYLHTAGMALVAASLLLVLLTLPLTLELWVLSAMSLARRRQRSAQAEPISSLAAIIPAHNEEMLVAKAVSSLLASGDPCLQVYVVAHNCTDQTAARAQAAGARVLLLDDRAGGKGLALDFGFRHALAHGADAVMVVDADSTVSAGLPLAVRTAIGAGAAAVQARYTVANAGDNQRTRLAELALLGMNVVRPRGRDALGLSCGIFGNGFALAASTLARVPYSANSLVEDLEYHLHLLDAGLRVRFLDQVSVLGEMPAGAAAASSQRARWEGGRRLMRRRWASVLLGRVARGQWRMAEPLLDLLAFPLATQMLLMVAGLALGLAAKLLLDQVASTLTVLALVLLAVSLAAVPLYLLASAMVAAAPAATLHALAGAPGYLLWKLALRTRTRRTARADAAWVRTARNGDPGACVVDPPSNRCD